MLEYLTDLIDVTPLDVSECLDVLPVDCEDYEGECTNMD